jgi:hypothetical protein
VGVGSDHSVWRYARSRSAPPPRYVPVSSVAVTRMEPGVGAGDVATEVVTLPVTTLCYDSDDNALLRVPREYRR